MKRVKTLTHDVDSGMLMVSSTDPSLMTDEEQDSKVKKKLTRQQTWKKMGSTARVMSKLGGGMSTPEERHVVSCQSHSFSTDQCWLFLARGCSGSGAGEGKLCCVGEDEDPVPFFPPTGVIGLG